MLPGWAPCTAHSLEGMTFRLFAEAEYALCRMLTRRNTDVSGKRRPVDQYPFARISRIH